MSELVSRGPTAITEAARREFTEAQAQAIRRTIAKDCSPEEFVMFMEIVGRYQLDPFTGQIWPVKYPGRNGSSGKVQIVVGRDGFLAIAQRHADFGGVHSDVVREKDTFRVSWPGPVVTHEYDTGAERGPIIGAWALGRRGTRLPSYFYARMDEYKGNSGPWRQYPSAMVKKVAESVVLRQLYSISGIVHEAEIDVAVGEPQEPQEEMDWGSPGQEARLRELFEQLGYRDRKARMELRNLDEAGRDLLIERLETELPDEPPEAEVVEAVG